MANEAKVKRYYQKFREASDEFDGYLKSVGEALAEAKFIARPSDFLDEIDRKTANRESTRLALERVVREERVSVGPITVEQRTTVEYNGQYLFDFFKDSPEVRDQLVEVQYKVKTPEFKRLVDTGVIRSDVAERAVVDRKVTVALKGLPGKIGLL